MSGLPNYGAEVGISCPKCGEQVLYNGNYFCTNWEDGCDWALSHGEDGEPVGAADRKVWRTIKQSPWFKEQAR